MEDDFPDGNIDNVFIYRKSDTEMDDRETIPYTSPKRENNNEIHNREVILYALPRGENKDEVD